MSKFIGNFVNEDLNWKMHVKAEHRIRMKTWPNKWEFLLEVRTALRNYTRTPLTLTSVLQFLGVSGTHAQWSGGVNQASGDRATLFSLVLPHFPI